MSPKAMPEVNGWTSPQMLRRYGASARSARARRNYERSWTPELRRHRL
jgi:integrase/recombinase XerD